MNTLSIEKQTLKHITFPAITITFERISDRLTQVFTPVELKEYLSLFDKAQSHPKDAEKQVEQLHHKYPDLPELYNLLSYVAIKRKKIKKAELLIEENYRKNPDNLFAKINYADQCLRKNKIAKIPHIFDQKMNLQELCPHQKVYHFSETMGFICLMGFYHLKQRQREIAMDYCAYAKLIDANDPTVGLLEKKIYQRSFIQSIMEALKPKFSKARVE